MSKHIRSWLAVLVVAGLTAGAGCGSHKTKTDMGPSGAKIGEACDTGPGCAGKLCVELADGDKTPVYCTQSCGTCPSGYYCDTETFKLAKVSFCRIGAKAAMPPPLPEAPRLLCAQDSDCPDGTFCGTSMGVNDCAIPCAVNDDCAILMGQYKLHFSKCMKDEGHDRQLCMPDPSCYPRPDTCFGM